MHLAVLLGRRPSVGDRCICGGAGATLFCERCLRPLHGACYLQVVAGAAERAWLTRANDEDPVGLPAGRSAFIFCCPVCRS